MRKIALFISGIWYYIWGNIVAFCIYDRKYIKGKWFKGKIGSFGSVGWTWVVSSARARRKYRVNLTAKFPVAIGCRVVHPENIEFDPDDLNNFQSYGIYYQAIGQIKMNAVILPGVTLGPNTTVGAGSVVTTSFAEGNCIIAGNPARLLYRLDSKEEN